MQPVQLEAAQLKRNAEAAVRATQDHFIQQDIRALALADIGRPFNSFGDAIDRLFPMHVGRYKPCPHAGVG